MTAVPRPGLATQRAAPELTGRLMLLGSAACYGLNIPYARMAAPLGFPGPSLVVLRVALILFLVPLTALVLRQSLAVPAPDRAGLAGLGFASALVGLAYMSSVSFIPVGIAVLIFYTFPLLILAATPLVDNVRLLPRQVAACIVAFAGIVLAIGPSLGVLDWRGLALAALASVAAATQLFFASRAPGGGGLASMFWVQVAILPVAAVAALWFGGGARLEKFGEASWPLTLTTLYFIVGFVLQIRGLKSTTAAAAGLIYCLEPVVAVASAAWILGERLTPAQYFGAALVLAAVAFSMAGPRPTPQAA